MSSFEYSYALIKYRHDRAADEVLNVGVVLYCPATGQVSLRWSQRYGRLSEAFAHFDGEGYRRTMNRLDAALTKLGSSLSGGLFQLDERERYSDVSDILRAVWRDQGMAYFAGRPAFGVTEDLDAESRDLFDRFVLSQHDGREAVARYDDDAVWSDVKRLLTERGIVDALQFKVLGPAQIEFPHAWKNERWHVLEPLSLDYANAAEMKHRALVTLGKASAVRDEEDFGTFTVIVGRPRRIEADKQFAEAMRLLSDIPVEHKIVLEEDLEQFASDLQAKISAHRKTESASAR